MNWTAKKPTIPCLYWYRKVIGPRNRAHTPGQIVKVTPKVGQLVAVVFGNVEPQDFSEWPDEWYGPLEEPPA